jgi:putative drug exporter of the RND superfamily
MQVEESSQTERTTSEGSADSLANRGMYRFGLAYGRFIYRWRWLVLIFWVLVLGVSAPFAMKLTTLLTSGGYSFSGSESVQVGNILIDTLHQAPSQAIVVFQSSTTQVSDPAYQQEIQAFTARLKGFPDVRDITPGTVGQDGRTTFVLIGFTADYDVMQQHMAALRSLLPTGNQASPAQAKLTGQLPVTDEMNTVTQNDAERADAEVFPLALLVLLVVFGTFTAAILPLILAGLSIVIALAMIYPLAVHTSLSSFIISISSVVGLGISIDYSLFIVRRFREELARGRSPQEAVAWTVTTAGEAILFSGLIVMIGFIGLLLIGISMTSSDGIGGACVVIAAVLVALTLLPAILGIMGQKINAFRLPWLWRLSMASPDGKASDRPTFWHRLALGVMRRPIVVVVAVCAVLIALAWPVFSMTIGTDSAEILPSTSQARQGLNIVQEQFPSIVQNPVDLIVETKDGSNMLSAVNLNHLASLDQWLAQQEHITGVSGLMQPPATPGSSTLSQQQLLALYTSGTYQGVPALQQYVTSTTSGNLTWITLNTNTALDSDPGKALIDHLRAEAGQNAPGLTILVGGIQATYQDFDRYLYGNFPKAILFILVATYILLLIMFRSVLLPLKALIMNALSVCTAYGVLVFVFQWGHFSNILGFTSEGFIDSLIPILLFCVLFGLSMDYEVFLLSRIREEWLRTGDNTRSVALGLEKTGGVITNAALLFVLVTVAFTFTELIITKELGLGMTVAILVDATIIRSLLVPATMRLLGRWNWWLPGRPLPPKQTT